MIQRFKRMIGSIAAVMVSALIFCSWFVLPAETEKSVSVIDGVSIETEGAGRLASHEIAQKSVETSVDTIETETAENAPYIAPQAIEEIETEAKPETLVEVFPEADPVIETDIDALIVQVAAEYGLPWQLVRAVCWVESGLNPNAISSTGDYGLMQVSYVNHGWLGLTDPLDPESNLRAGCTILKTAIDNSDGDFTKALMRYNRGDAYAMSQWSQGIFSTAYTDKVLGKYYEYIREG